MSHVQPGAARIGEHIEDVKLWLGRIEIFLARIGRVKNLALVPDALPLRLDLIEGIRFAALAAHTDVLTTNGHELTRIQKNFVSIRVDWWLIRSSLSKMQQLLLATRNTHKTREFAQLLGDEFEISDLSGAAAPSIEETGHTFAENATLKALGVSRDPVRLVAADDSGLEVDALDGAPGIFSARYAGEKATDRENIDKLLGQLRRARTSTAALPGNGGASSCEPGVAGPPPSNSLSAARFRCVIALARDGKLLGTFEGAVEGLIVDIPRGHHGFGFDPIFVPNGFDKTFGELPAEIKNRISHRAKAIMALRETLRAVRN